MSIPVKKAVKLPVLVTGGVKSLEQADSLVEEGCADLIGVGRAIFKDPHWADEKPVLS
jgi:2,4-dienoyl-CoA reductase-like NADH-dependent reductase (Old Yellow Enzyme family)